MGAVMDWATLRDEITTASRACAALLDQVDDPRARIPPTAWSVGEVGAHLVSVPRRYRCMLVEDTPFPDSLSRLNQAEVDEIDEREPSRLGLLLHEEVRALFDVLGDDGGRPVPFFGVDHTVAGVGGVLLGELLLHGLDLAAVAGERWEIRRDQALAVTDGLVPSLENAVRRPVAERMPGTYHLRLRGGSDWTITVHDGAARIVRGRPARADLRVSADPVANLLVGYGRTPRWRAALLGQVVAWGRKPWRAVPFSSLFGES